MAKKQKESAELGVAEEISAASSEIEEIEESKEESKDSSAKKTKQKTIFKGTPRAIKLFNLKN